MTKDRSGHKPFDPKTSYCNGYDSAGEPWNICCYKHDVGYSNPQGKSRKQIDQEFLACSKRQENPKAQWMYRMLRLTGWTSWARCRFNDWRKK